jgi:hypothetical protein
VTRALSVEEERREAFVARTLQAGAYGSLTLLLLAALMMAAGWQPGHKLARIGVLVLIATPVMRIVAAIFMYAKSRDWNMVWVSCGVLTIVLVSTVWGIAG